jgi:hypothetical protein
MNFDITQITTNAIVIVPIVIALTQAIKLTGFIPDHFSPLLAIAIGIVIGFLDGHENPDMTANILSGAIYGLMSSGLYSGVKTTMIAHSRMKERKLKNSAQKYSRNNQDNC